MSLKNSVRVVCTHHKPLSNWLLAHLWQALCLWHTYIYIFIYLSIPEQPNVGKHVVEAEKMRNERGVQFFVGSSFYREESAVGRDLACLAAAVYKKDKGRLHVLDALSGCGIRAARYLAHAQADFVWANDACDALDTLMAHNLSLASSSSTYDTVPLSHAVQLHDILARKGASKSRHYV